MHFTYCPKNTVYIFYKQLTQKLSDKNISYKIITNFKLYYIPTINSCYALIMVEKMVTITSAKVAAKLISTIHNFYHSSNIANFHSSNCKCEWDMLLDLSFFCQIMSNYFHVKESVMCFAVFGTVFILNILLNTVGYFPFTVYQ